MCLTAGRASLECQMSSTSGHAATSLLEWYRFGIVFINQKSRVLTRFGWALAWLPHKQIFLYYLVQTWLRAQKVSFFRATVSFFYKNAPSWHIFIMSIFLSFLQLKEVLLFCVLFLIFVSVSNMVNFWAPGVFYNVVMREWVTGRSP